ncbi:MAG: hypothetical protein ACT4PU_12785 [Planctomycetota bacterium]
MIFALAFAACLCSPAQVTLDRPEQLLPENALGTLRVPSGLRLWESELGETFRAVAEAGDGLAELRQLGGLVGLITGGDSEQLLIEVLGGESVLAVYGPANQPDEAQETAEDGADGGQESKPAKSAKRRVLAVARAADAENLKRGFDALVALAASGPKSGVRRGSHAGVPTVRFKQGAAAACTGPWLLVASDQALLHEGLARAADLSDASANLSSDFAAQSSATDVPSSTALFEFRLDTELLESPALRLPLAPAKLLGKRLVNPLANLLLGGLTLGAGEVRGTLTAESGALLLSAQFPAAPSDAPAAYFPPASAQPAVVPVSSETLAVLFLRRDLSDWWRQRESLLSSESQARLAKADETLGLLFGGLSPAEDVFAQLGPDLALVLDRQLFADGQPVPALRLPGACLVATLGDPQGFLPSLQVAFQSLIAFLNTTRAREHQPPFLISTHEHEGVQVHTARLLSSTSATGEADAVTSDANASPALACVGTTLLVGTSGEQVERLISALHAGHTQPGLGSAQFSLDLVALTALARDNQTALQAQSMLEKGLSPAEAGRELDGLLALLERFHSAEALLQSGAESLELQVRLHSKDRP